jgi:hypothetical protein
MHGHAGAVDVDCVQSKAWLLVVFAKAVEQAVTGGNTLG